MDNNQIELYLAEIEKLLWQLPASTRSNAIVNLKKHIDQDLQNNPGKKVNEVLVNQGAAEYVAKRLLLDHNLDIKKPKKRSFFKWLMIAVFGFFMLGFLSIGLIIWKFTPLISINEKDQRVQILGGLIDINEEQGNFKLGGSINIDNGTSQTFSGIRDLEDLNIQKIMLELDNAHLKVSNSKDRQLSYNCNSNSAPKIIEEIDTIVFDLKKADSSNCKFTIPKGSAFKVIANNGNFTFNEVQNPIIMKAKNGKIQFIPKSESKYQYNLSIENGKIDDFKNSNDSAAYKIEMSLNNGVISK